MAHEKGQEDNQHDKSKDDKDTTIITNAPHRLEELRMMVRTFNGIRLSNSTSSMKNLVITNRNHYDKKQIPSTSHQTGNTVRHVVW